MEKLSFEFAEIEFEFEWSLVRLELSFEFGKIEFEFGTFEF